MILWLDDIRNPADYGLSATYWFKSFKDFRKLFRIWHKSSFPKVTEIHLDHDLGDMEEDKTGYDALLLIEEMLYGGNLKSLKTIYVHTSNPSAATKMMSVKGIFRDKFGVEMKRSHY